MRIFDDCSPEKCTVDSVVLGFCFLEARKVQAGGTAVQGGVDKSS